MNRARQQIFDWLCRHDDFVSGDVLAEALKLSRTAVWKHVQALRQAGLDIEAVAGKGYRLRSDRLNAAAIAQHLREAGSIAHLGRHIDVLPQTDSTNSELLRRLDAQDAAHGTVLLAESQTQGRGRLGRRWHSEPETSLTFSILLRPHIPPQRASSLPLLVACALHQALHAWAPALRLKWPNDLLYGEAKLGGILLEMRAEPERVQAIVIGIGLNIHPPRDGWPTELRQPPIALADIAGRTLPRRNRIAAHCLHALDQAYTMWQTQGFAPFRDYWWRYHVASNRRVRVHHDGRYIEGIARALDEQGALLLERDGALQRILAGDLEVMT